MGALTQRERVRKGLQAAHRRLRALKGGHREQTVLLNLQVQLLQPRGLAQGELRLNPGKWRSRPQRQRLGQCVVRPCRHVLPQEVSTFLRKAFEPERVDLLRLEHELVAAAVGAGADVQVVLCETCAGPRGESAQCRNASLRKPSLPDIVKEYLRGHAGSRRER